MTLYQAETAFPSGVFSDVPEANHIVHRDSWGSPRPAPPVPDKGSPRLRKTTHPSVTAASRALQQQQQARQPKEADVFVWKKPGDLSAEAAARRDSEGSSSRNSAPQLPPLSISPFIHPRDESLGCLSHREERRRRSRADKGKGRAIDPPSSPMTSSSSSTNHRQPKFTASDLALRTPPQSNGPRMPPSSVSALHTIVDEHASLRRPHRPPPVNGRALPHQRNASEPLLVSSPGSRYREVGLVECSPADPPNGLAAASRPPLIPAAHPSEMELMTTAAFTSRRRNKNSIDWSRDMATDPPLANLIAEAQQPRQDARTRPQTPQTTSPSSSTDAAQGSSPGGSRFANLAKMQLVSPSKKMSSARSMSGIRALLGNREKSRDRPETPTSHEPIDPDHVMTSVDGVRLSSQFEHESDKVPLRQRAMSWRRNGHTKGKWSLSSVAEREPQTVEDPSAIYRIRPMRKLWEDNNQEPVSFPRRPSQQINDNGLASPTQLPFVPIQGHPFQSPRLAINQDWQPNGLPFVASPPRTPVKPTHDRSHSTDTPLVMADLGRLPEQSDIMAQPEVNLLPPIDASSDEEGDDANDEEQPNSTPSSGSFIPSSSASRYSSREPSDDAEQDVLSRYYDASETNPPLKGEDDPLGQAEEASDAERDPLSHQTASSDPVPIDLTTLLIAHKEKRRGSEQPQMTSFGRSGTSATYVKQQQQQAILERQRASLETSRPNANGHSPLPGRVSFSDARQSHEAPSGLSMSSPRVGSDKRKSSLDGSVVFQGQGSSHEGQTVSQPEFSPHPFARGFPRPSLDGDIDEEDDNANVDDDERSETSSVASVDQFRFPQPPSLSPGEVKSSELQDQPANNAEAEVPRDEQATSKAPQGQIPLLLGSPIASRTRGSPPMSQINGDGFASDGTASPRAAPALQQSPQVPTSPRKGSRGSSYLSGPSWTSSPPNGSTNTPVEDGATSASEAGTRSFPTDKSFLPSNLSSPTSSSSGGSRHHHPLGGSTQHRSTVSTDSTETTATDYSSTFLASRQPSLLQAFKEEGTKEVRRSSTPEHEDDEVVGEDAVGLKDEQGSVASSAVNGRGHRRLKGSIDLLDRAGMVEIQEE